MAGSPLIERWRELRPLFDQALDLEGAAREAFLRALASAQPDLHDGLLRLLEQHDESSALAQPAAGLAAAVLLAESAPQTSTLQSAPAPHIGRVVGPYRLSHLIGSGGMGSVYLGQRISGGFRQRVAIKLIAGLHPGLAERFAQERQILADLNHPNIPPLLDGGETEDGMPWFATEYVEGETLIDYASRRDIDTDARISLLLRVAEALAYAHRQRVVHRDIKPGNILVTANGTVKLLDFGIAKLLDDSAGGALTRQALGPMTPEYAAPEQFRGEPAGPATDIYQFGVLAWRLLGGGYPYRAQPADALAFARAVCEEPALLLPVPTSDTTLRPEQRRTQRRQWQALQAIVDRCLAKRPAQRWADMGQLIAELETVRTPGRVSVALGWQRVLRSSGLHWIAGTGLAVALALLLVWQPFAVDPWARSAGLHAMGLSAQHVHAAREDTDASLRRALRAEADGDLDRCFAVLESIHQADLRTPVPALLLGYWSGARDSRSVAQGWLEQARERLEDIDDPYMHLLLRFIEAEHTDDHDAILRYAGALVDAKPHAWYFRLARAHILNARALRAAALAELQQIHVDELDHRKLVDAIADRASLGDLAGARAMAAALTGDTSAPERSMLLARLAYSAGSLQDARGHFADAVVRAREVAHFAIEARALLYLGVVEASLGNYPAADLQLRSAEQRLRGRRQFNFAVDAALAQAQLAAAIGEPDHVQTHIETARELREQQRGSRADPMIDLFAARLLGEVPVDLDAQPPAVRALLQARRALIDGERQAASEALERARRHEVEVSPWLEEYALLCRELGEHEPALPPIDPPFQPYARFASRWALAAGASVVPAAP